MRMGVEISKDNGDGSEAVSKLTGRIGVFPVGQDGDGVAKVVCGRHFEGAAPVTSTPNSRATSYIIAWAYRSPTTMMTVPRFSSILWRR
jgi:hypothetical protein